MDLNEKIQMRFRVNEVFTPGTPIEDKDLFGGRIQLVERVVQILSQPGQHAIIFGERGVGKTSLSQVIHGFLIGPKGIIAPHIDCATTDNYSAIWRRVFSKIEVTFDKQTMGFKQEDASEHFTLADTIKGDFTPDKVQDALERLVAQGNVVIVILDEFDRIKNRDVRRLIADTIKSMSDRRDRATLLIVGVADAVTDLIAEHESVERNLVQLPMPRMSVSELGEIVSKGVARLQMKITSEAMSQISFLSRGFPFYYA